MDFAETPDTVKRTLYTEAAQRDLDVTARILEGDRVLFQVFDPSGQLPKLPDMPDARKKYPWDLWLNGETHLLTPGEVGEISSFRPHAYKIAAARGLKLSMTVYIEGQWMLQAYK